MKVKLAVASIALLTVGLVPMKPAGAQVLAQTHVFWVKITGSKTGPFRGETTLKRVKTRWKGSGSRLR